MFVKPTGYGYAQYFLMPPRDREAKQELRERVDADKVEASAKRIIIACRQAGAPTASLKLIKASLEAAVGQRIDIRA